MSKRRIEVMDPFIKKKRLVTRFQTFVMPCFNSSFTSLCRILIKLSVRTVAHTDLGADSSYFNLLEDRLSVRNRHPWPYLCTSKNQFDIFCVHRFAFNVFDILLKFSTTNGFS